MNPALLATVVASRICRNYVADGATAAVTDDRPQDYAEYPLLTRWRLRWIRSQLRRGVRKRALTGAQETKRETRLWADYFRLLEGKK